MVTPIRQWRVKAPHDASERVFEDEANAWSCAKFCAEAATPSVITGPDDLGNPVFYVFRAHEYWEVSTRHRFAGTTRQVVEP